MQKCTFQNYEFNFNNNMARKRDQIKILTFALIRIICGLLFEMFLHQKINPLSANGRRCKI